MLSPPAFLNTSARIAQHNYLIAYLLLLCRYKCLRVYTTAYALFPLRTQSGACKAAQRVVSNAVKNGYVRSYCNTMTGRRYYALSIKGALFLNSLDADYDAQTTVPALKAENREHREWGVLIAIASEHRAMQGFSEALIAGSMHQDIVNYFGYVPDAVTLFETPNGRVALWHEVETSRRSTTRRATTPTVLCGIEKFAHLIKTLRDKCYLIRNDRKFTLILVVHCGTEKIEREIRALTASVIKPFSGKATDSGYVINFASSGAGEMQILINQLPAEHEKSWNGVLPWAGCVMPAVSQVDRFVQRPQAAASAPVR